MLCIDVKKLWLHFLLCQASNCILQRCRANSIIDNRFAVIIKINFTSCKWCLLIGNVFVRMLLSGRLLLPKHFSSVELCNTSTPQLFQHFPLLRNNKCLHVLCSFCSLQECCIIQRVFTKTVQPWYMGDSDRTKLLSIKLFVSVLTARSWSERYNEKGNPISLVWCVSGLCERNEWDAMNVEPEEQMRGSGQVIRVVNYHRSSGE